VAPHPSNDKGISRVWLEEYEASAIGARLYAAMAGFQLEDGETVYLRDSANSRAQTAQGHDRARAARRRGRAPDEDHRER
jgi:hypothetical protein